MPESEPQSLENLKRTHREALDALEDAQSRVLDAMTLICPVNGLADEWTMLGELYETIKSHWHTLEKARSKIAATNPDDRAES